MTSNPEDTQCSVHSRIDQNNQAASKKRDARYSEEGTGYGGHGGRPGSARPKDSRNSGTYVATYSRDSAYEFRQRSPESYEEEGGGYAGHGGRPVAVRPENDRYDSASREYMGESKEGEGKGYPVRTTRSK